MDMRSKAGELIARKHHQHRKSGYEVDSAYEGDNKTLIQEEPGDEYDMPHGEPYKEKESKID